MAVSVLEDRLVAFCVLGNLEVDPGGFSYGFFHGTFWCFFIYIYIFVYD